uniref:DUF4326 domain-containing protein n=1 Tax=Noctiluca scintillans TaxID=2966 RepID=A0A7S1A578_NOCSC
MDGWNGGWNTASWHWSEWDSWNHDRDGTYKGDGKGKMPWRDAPRDVGKGGNAGTWRGNDEWGKDGACSKGKWKADDKGKEGKKSKGKGEEKCKDTFKGKGKEMDKGKGKDKDKDKDKGKSKKPKTPWELNFSRATDSMLWVRQSLCKCGVPTELSGVEIGNLDEAKAARKGGSPLPEGAACLEILCNRQSILGNPFDMKKHEELRETVLAAYVEYFDAVLAGADEVDVDAMAVRHGLSVKENTGKDWRALYDAGGGPAGVRDAYEETRLLAAEHANRGEQVRLMCHCVPRACHVETIVDRLNGVTGPTMRRPLPSAVSSVVTASARDERPAKTAAAELGFEPSKPGGLLLRAARLCGGLLIAEGVELANLGETGVAGVDGLSPLPSGEAGVEVLCDRRSVLGNPFDMLESETQREQVLAAYADYLEAVLGAANIDFGEIAERHSLGQEHCNASWKTLYDVAGGAAMVRRACAELHGFLEEHRGRGERVRLVCHCAPRSCHTQLLVERLSIPGFLIEVENATSAPLPHDAAADRGDLTPRRKPFSRAPSNAAVDQIFSRYRHMLNDRTSRQAREGTEPSAAPPPE